MKVKGSYTVEAAIVMSIVLLVLGALIQTAFRWSGDAVGMMRLHEAEEYLRYHREAEKIRLSWPKVEAELKGRTVTGRYYGKKTEVQMEAGIYEPEEFIRMISLIVE